MTAASWKCSACNTLWAPHVDACRICSGKGGAKPLDETPLVDTLIEEWTNALGGLVAAKKLKASTADLYRRQAFVVVYVEIAMADGTHRRVGSLRWGEIDRSFCDRYRAARSQMPGRYGGNVRDNTINRDLTALTACLTWHVTDGPHRLPHNPLHGVRKPSERQFRRKTRLSMDTWMQVASFGPPILQDVALVAYRCIGMRPREAWELRKDELDHAAKEIHLRDRPGAKTGPRIILTTDDAWDVIVRRARESRGPYVFVDPRDAKRMRPVCQSTRQDWMRKARNRARDEAGITGEAGENIVFYSGRHGGLNDAADKMPIDDVAAHGGASLKTLETNYLKTNAASRQRSREMLNAAATGAPAPPPPSALPSPSPTGIATSGRLPPRPAPTMRPPSRHRHAR